MRRDRTAYSPRVLIRTPALKSETEDPTSGTQQTRATGRPVRLDALRYVFNDESAGHENRPWYSPDVPELTRAYLPPSISTDPHNRPAKPAY
jgi:hypothetical protein